jgi:hypothetical protein
MTRRCLCWKADVTVTVTGRAAKVSEGGACACVCACVRARRQRTVDAPRQIAGACPRGAASALTLNPTTLNPKTLNLHLSASSLLCSVRSVSIAPHFSTLFHTWSTANAQINPKPAHLSASSLLCSARSASIFSRDMSVRPHDVMAAAWVVSQFFCQLLVSC